VAGKFLATKLKKSLDSFCELWIIVTLHKELQREKVEMKKANLIQIANKLGYAISFSDDFKVEWFAPTGKTNYEGLHYGFSYYFRSSGGTRSEAYQDCAEQLIESGPPVPCDLPDCDCHDDGDIGNQPIPDGVMKEDWYPPLVDEVEKKS
jgi:hypothetical protein